MKQMKLKIFPLLLIAFLLIGCGQQATPIDEASVIETAEEAQEEGAIDDAEPTLEARRGTTILADGTLVAIVPEVAVSFTTNGRLQALNVVAGERVSAGDVIATLDDSDLMQAVAEAGLAVTQAENDLAQAQLTLNDLLNWEPDDEAVALAEANLAAAQANFGDAQTLDAVAGSGATAARINLEQAQRRLAAAQDAYDLAFDPGREWELFTTDPSCLPGQQFPNCTGTPYNVRLENERDFAEQNITASEEGLEIARAEYSLAIARVDNNSALGAEASIASAEQSLAAALRGPKESEITSAELTVAQRELGLEQAQFNLAKAQEALDDAQLLAPIGGVVLSVGVAPGALVGAGTVVVTLLDSEQLQFETSNLSERDLAQVSGGQGALVTLKSFPSEPIGGTVLRVVPKASGTVGDAATFTAVIVLDETDLELLPGMTGRVEIVREAE